MKRRSRAAVQDPRGSALHFLLLALHSLIFLGVIAIIFGENDIFFVCGFLVLLILVVIYRVGRWVKRRRHPERMPLDVRRLLDSRVTITLSDPEIIAIVRSRDLQGTIDALVEFRRRREILVRIDHAVDANNRLWEWMALVPATEGLPVVDLLRMGSMEVRVHLVLEERVERVKGKFRPRREPGLQSVSLERGRATLPGLTR